jgi:hypothetical protein
MGLIVAQSVRARAYMKKPKANPNYQMRLAMTGEPRHIFLNERDFYG